MKLKWISYICVQYRTALHGWLFCITVHASKKFIFRFLSIRCVNYCKVFNFQPKGFKVFAKIFHNFCENFVKFMKSLAKINDFIYYLLFKIVSSKFRISRNFKNAVSQPPFLEYVAKNNCHIVAKNCLSTPTPPSSPPYSRR